MFVAFYRANFSNKIVLHAQYTYLTVGFILLLLGDMELLSTEGFISWLFTFMNFKNLVPYSEHLHTGKICRWRNFYRAQLQKKAVKIFYIVRKNRRIHFYIFKNKGSSRTQNLKNTLYQILMVTSYFSFYQYQHKI